MTSEVEEIWEYLPADDEEDASTAAPCAEDAAMHVDVPVDWQRPIVDPGRRDVDTSDLDPIDIEVAEDEDDGSPPGDDHEIDVEELLERQHYVTLPTDRR